MSRLTRKEAHSILATCGIAQGSDFHALTSGQVDALLEQAKQRKYRKRPDAPASTVRMFHAYIERAAGDYGTRSTSPDLGPLIDYVTR